MGVGRKSDEDCAWEGSFSALNAHLQSKYKIALSPIFVVESFLRDEISPQIASLLCKLDEIRKEDAPDQAALEFSPAAPD